MRNVYSYEHQTCMLLCNEYANLLALILEPHADASALVRSKLAFSERNNVGSITIPAIEAHYLKNVLKNIDIKNREQELLVLLFNKITDEIYHIVDDDD